MAPSAWPLRYPVSPDAGDPTVKIVLDTSGLMALYIKKRKGFQGVGFRGFEFRVSDYRFRVQRSASEAF